MKKLQQIISCLRYNFWVLVGFEAVLKAMTLMVFAPFLTWSFKGIMNLTGYNYLTFDNLLPFLWNPLTILLILGLIIFITLYIIFDIITVIVILDQSCQKRKIRIVQAVWVSLCKCKSLFRKGNWGFLGWALLMTPFISVGVATSFLTTLRVPSFILEFIWQHSWLAVLVIGVIGAWLVLLMRWIYALHFYVIEGRGFRQAIQESMKLNRGKVWLKDMLVLMLTQVLVTGAYLLVTAVGILMIMLVAKIWGGTLGNDVVVGAIWALITMTFVLSVILALPICYAMVSVLFYRHQESQGREVKHLELKTTEKATQQEWRVTGVIWTMIVLVILEFAVFNYRFQRGDYNAVMTQLVGTEVTAHRGASVSFPENTMLAFREASRLGADYIELDVQMTKDGEIVVAHDRSLARVAGVKKNIDELTLNEIRELEVGSYFAEEFRGEPVPTLQEVLEFAKEADIKLNIELKPVAGMEGFAQKVIGLVEEAGYQNNVVLSSTSYELLREVEEIRGSLTTVYVMGMMYGDVSELKAADGFSLEASNVTLAFVNEMHELGKVVYAWTVNSEDKIWRMVEMGVDNVITDDVPLAQEVISQNRTSGFVNEYVRLIRSILWW